LRESIKKEDIAPVLSDIMEVDSDVEEGVQSLETLRNSKESAPSTPVKLESTPKTRGRAASAAVALDLVSSEEESSDDEYREAMSRRRSASLSTPTKRIKMEPEVGIDEEEKTVPIREEDNIGPIDWSKPGMTASVPQRSGLYDRDKFLASLDDVAARCSNKISPLTKEQALLKAQETINSAHFRADFNKFYPKAVRRVALQQRGIVRGNDNIPKDSKISALIRCEPPLFVFFYLGRTLCANAVSSRLKGVVTLLPVMLVRHSFPIDDWTFKRELDGIEEQEENAIADPDPKTADSGSQTQTETQIE
jgi:hypothetical protein